MQLHVEHNVEYPQLQNNPDFPSFGVEMEQLWFTGRNASMMHGKLCSWCGRFLFQFCFKPWCQESRARNYSVSMQKPDKTPEHACFDFRGCPQTVLYKRVWTLRLSCAVLCCSLCVPHFTQVKDSIVRIRSCFPGGCGRTCLRWRVSRSSCSRSQQVREPHRHRQMRVSELQVNNTRNVLTLKPLYLRSSGRRETDRNTEVLSSSFRLLHQPRHDHGHVLHAEGAWPAPRALPQQVAVPLLRVHDAEPHVRHVPSRPLVPRRQRVHPVPHRHVRILRSW